MAVRAPVREADQVEAGLVHLPRDAAFMKLAAMVEGTRLVRQELTR